MSPMNNRRMTPMAEPGVLDFAPGAAAAYSLRSLSNSYAGPVVTVRRSTDSAEADFTASEVSDGTLAAWCGGGDGFVKQWWSQTGSNHASQSISSVQPQIVDAGALILDGEKPALLFDGAGGRLKSNFSETYAQPATIVSVSGGRIGASQYLYDGTGAGYRLAILTDAASVKYMAGVLIQQIQQVDGSQVLFAIFNGASSIASTNGAVDVLAGNIGTDGLNGINIGARYSATNFYSGTISELLIYPTDQTALRTRIEGSIAWTYNA